MLHRQAVPHAIIKARNCLPYLRHRRHHDEEDDRHRLPRRHLQGRRDSKNDNTQPNYSDLAENLPTFIENGWLSQK